MSVKGYLGLLVGGEEFLVVLPATGPGEAAAAGERTRRAIAATPVSLADGPLAVTTSVGVASGAEDGWECLVRRADTGLYAAKEGGRDRVMAGRPRSLRPAREASHRKAKMRQDTDDGKRPGDTGKRRSGWPTSR